MKFASLAALGLAAVALPVAAQNAPAPAAPVAPAAAFTLDTPIETLVADPRAKAVLDSNLPGPIDQHPQYQAFKQFSLNMVAGYAPQMLTPELLAKIAAGLAEIK